MQMTIERISIDEVLFYRHAAACGQGLFNADHVRNGTRRKLCCQIILRDVILTKEPYSQNSCWGLPCTVLYFFDMGGRMLQQHISRGHSAGQALRLQDLVIQIHGLHI